MGDELVLFYSPFLFVAMALYILFELIRIRFILNLWEIEALMIIPIIVAGLYLWIGVGNPSIEAARLWLRFVLGTSLGIGMRVAFSYSKTIRQQRGYL